MYEVKMKNLKRSYFLTSYDVMSFLQFEIAIKNDQLMISFVNQVIILINFRNRFTALIFIGL